MPHPLAASFALGLLAMAVAACGSDADDRPRPAPSDAPAAADSRVFLEVVEQDDLDRLSATVEGYLRDARSGEGEPSNLFLATCDAVTIERSIGLAAGNTAGAEIPVAISITTDDPPAGHPGGDAPVLGARVKYVGDRPPQQFWVLRDDRWRIDCSAREFEPPDDQPRLRGGGAPLVVLQPDEFDPSVLIHPAAESVSERPIQNGTERTYLVAEPIEAVRDYFQSAGLTLAASGALFYSANLVVGMERTILNTAAVEGSTEVVVVTIDLAP